MSKKNIWRSPSDDVPVLYSEGCKLQVESSVVYTKIDSAGAVIYCYQLASSSKSVADILIGKIDFNLCYDEEFRRGNTRKISTTKIRQKPEIRQKIPAAKKRVIGSAYRKYMH